MMHLLSNKVDILIVLEVLVKFDDIWVVLNQAGFRNNDELRTFSNLTNVYRIFTSVTNLSQFFIFFRAIVLMALF